MARDPISDSILTAGTVLRKPCSHSLSRECDRCRLTPLYSAPFRNADERISAIASAHPTEPALIAGDRRVTFDELEAHTNRVAACLSDRGIGRGDIVAVRLNSCIEIAPTLRAILRLGAIFVPLDPDHPNDRIDYVLNDANARVLITTEALVPYPGPAGGLVLTIENFASLASFVAGANTSLEDPASILYTSGSTGKPKGVVRRHCGLVSRLAWESYEPDDIFCHNMSLCYGFSQERIFLPLMSGLPLAILSDGSQKDAAQFAGEVEQLHVTQITVVPAFLEQLVDPRHRLYERLQTVRSVTVGSAFLPIETINRFHEVLPRSRLVNVYGSTESGTLTRGEMTARSEPNVGVVAPHMEVFILDEHFQPVSAGEVGELYGGGPSLAAGYWRQPELTAERFIPNPFGTAIPILYRTGDRGRFLPDGRVQLVGRADRQVKVRGHRVELAEVETALLEMQELREAIVIGQPLAQDSRLIAYVCPHVERTVSISTIRHHLRAHVPNYMLPSAYVFLPNLPRTAIGKVDASALPTPGLSRPDLENPYVPPSTPLENSIADAWADVLEKDCVGRNDHFLDLGGDSMNAVKISAELEDRLGVQIDVLSCFELPTVGEMAEWLEGQMANPKRL